MSYTICPYGTKVGTHPRCFRSSQGLTYGLRSGTRSIRANRPCRAVGQRKLSQSSVMMSRLIHILIGGSSPCRVVQTHRHMSTCSFGVSGVHCFRNSDHIAERKAFASCPNARDGSADDSRQRSHPLPSSQGRVFKSLLAACPVELVSDAIRKEAFPLFFVRCVKISQNTMTKIRWYERVHERLQIKSPAR
jgi:hypothetical protein